MPKLKRLSLKNKKFARAFIKHNGNGADAAMESLDVKNRDSARRAAFDQLEQPMVQAEIHRLLNESDLNLESITKESRDLITSGLKAKPSFAAAVGHLEFLYKLHGVSPINKSIAMKWSAKQEIASQDVTKLTEQLEKLNSSVNGLLTLASK